SADPESPAVHALLGPWAHNNPHQAAPGPGIDFIAEALRWWDKWMNGIDNGVEAQPQLRAYVPDSTPVYSDREARPGRWIAEQTWPSPQITDTVLPTSEAEISAVSPLDSTALLGYQGGSWLQFGEDRKSTRLNSSHVSISYA